METDFNSNNNDDIYLQGLNNDMIYVQDECWNNNLIMF